MKKILKKPILAYSIIFFIVFLIAIIPHQIRSGTIFSFGLFTDSFKQHLIFLRDFTNHIRNIPNGVPLQIFRYDLGLGGDFFTSFAFYSLFDPLTIIAYILPRELIAEAFYIIGIIRLYLTGLVMLFCLKRFKITTPLTLIVVSLFYVFNVTVLFSSFRHPMFVNGPLFFPLIIIGIDKVFNKENPALLISASFLALITQFYFFMFACIGFELVVIIRLCLQRKEKKVINLLKNFILINFFYLLGALVGSFVLFPQFFASINSGRIIIKKLVFYDSLDYATYFSSFFIPIVGKHYTSLIGNIVVFFIVVAYVFLKPKKWESILFIVLSIMIFIPIVGYSFNLFTYVNNRWTYLLLTPTSLLLAYALEQIYCITDRHFNKSLQVIVFITCLVIVLLLISLVKHIFPSIFTVISVIVGFIILLLLIPKIFKLNLISKIQKHLSYPKLVSSTLILSFITLIIMSLAYFFTMTSSSDLKAYEEADVFSTINEDKSFFRVEQNVFTLGSTSLANDSLLGEYKSTHAYNTMGNGYVQQVLAYYDVIRESATAGYEGFNQRSPLLAINNVKYIIVRASEKTNIPYGFSYFASIQTKKTIPNQYNPVGLGYLDDDNYEESKIYRNDLFLPFGFVYHEYLTKSDLEGLSIPEKENLLLKACLVDEELNLPKYLINSSIITKTPQITVLDSIELVEGGFIALKNEAKLKLSLDGLTNHELLIEITNLSNLDKNKDFSFYYETSKTKIKETSYGLGTNFYYHNPNHLVNLGYYDEGNVEITLTIPKGKYTYSDIIAYLRPMASFENDINNLKQDILKNLEFKQNGFDGEITLLNKGILQISLPYHDGFKAYVDGKETKILKTNIGYMGIFLEEGKHNISFTYQTPYLKLSLTISLVALIISLMIIIGYCFIKKYYSPNKKIIEYFGNYYQSSIFMIITYILAVITWLIKNPFIFMAYASLNAIIIVTVNAKRINLVTLVFAALIIPRASDYNTNAAIYFITVGFAAPFIFYDIFTSKYRYYDLLFFAFLGFFVANALSLINTTILNILPATMGVFISFAYFLIYWYLDANTDSDDKEVILKNAFSLGLAIAIEFLLFIVTYEGQIIGKNIDLNWAQSNGIAMLVLLIIPLNIALYVIKQKKSYFLIGVACEICILFLTLSKGAYLAFIVIMIPLLIASWSFIESKKKLIFDFMLVALLIVLIIWKLSNLDKVAIGIENYLASMDARGWFNDPARIEIYQKGLDVFKKHPLLGAGSYTTVEGLSSNYDHYHNFIIHTLATTGLVGLTAFIFYLFAMIKKTFTKEPYHIFSLITIVAMLIHGLFDNSWYKPLVMVAIAIIASQFNKKNKELKKFA